VGLRIYDTTADADPGHAALLARGISELTTEHVGRDRNSCEARIEVVVFPLPGTTMAMDRAVACIAHNEAERTTRLVMPDPSTAASWYLPELRSSSYYKVLWVINELETCWQDGLRKALEEARTSLYRRWSDSYPTETDAERGRRGHFLDVAYE
jgi:hypothetical protein